MASSIQPSESPCSHSPSASQVVERSGRWTDEEVLEKSVSSLKWERSSPGGRRPAAPPAFTEVRPTEPSADRARSQGARPAGDAPHPPGRRTESPPPERPTRHSPDRHRHTSPTNALVRHDRHDRREDDTTTTTRFESFGELSTREELSTHRDSSSRKDSSIRREVSTRQESSTTRVHQEISHQVVSQSQQVRREFRLSDLPDPNGHRISQRALPAAGHEYSPSPEPETASKRRGDREPGDRQYKAHLVVKLSDERTSPASDNGGRKPSRASEDRGTSSRDSEDRRKFSRDTEDRWTSSLPSKGRGLFSRAPMDREATHSASEDSGLSSYRVSEDRSSSVRRSEDRSVEERTQVMRTQTVRTSSFGGRGAGPGRPERTAYSQVRPLGDP